MSPRLERWVVKGGQETRRGHGNTTLPPPVTPPVYVPQMLKDPGQNQYMIGWSLGPNGNASLSQLQDNPGYPGNSKVSVLHDYSGNGQGIDYSHCDTTIAAGMIPSLSMKFGDAGAPGVGAASIASGARDNWIDTMAEYCISKAPHVIILCYFHEPGGNFGSSANTQAMKDYRDATRRMVLRMRTAGVTNVMWQPILETPWNFAGSGVSGAPVSGSPSWMDFRYWHADWDWRNNRWFDTLTMDLFGVDLYTPMIGGGTYRQFSTDMGYVKTKLAASGAPDWPFTIMEHGMNNDAVGHNWVDYATKMRNYMKANNVKIQCYWDNSDDIGRYSFGPPPAGHGDASDFDPDGTKLQGYNILRDGSTKVVN